MKLYHDPLAASERAILDALNDFRSAVEAITSSGEIAVVRHRLRVLIEEATDVADDAATRADEISNYDGPSDGDAWAGGFAANH